MKINFFGKSFTFEMSNDNSKRKKQNTKRKKYSKRLFILILIYFTFGFLFEVYNFSDDYNVGDEVKEDVIAYKNVEYQEDILDDYIKEKIEKTTTPEYDINPDIESKAIQNLNIFFDILSVYSDMVKENSDKKEELLTEFIKDNKLDLSVAELSDIMDRQNSFYAFRTSEILKKIYEIGIVDEEDLSKLIENEKLNVDTLDRTLLKNFIIPNLTINKEKTFKKIQDNMDSLRNKKIKIFRGDILIKKGEKITPEVYKSMEMLNLVSSGDRIKKFIGLAISFIIISIVFYYVLKKYCKKTIESKAFYPSCITIAFMNLLFLFIFNKPTLYYMFPFMVIPIILMLVSKDTLFSLILSLFSITVFSYDQTWFLIMMTVTVVALYKTEMISNRQSIIKLCVFIGISESILSIGYSLINRLSMSSSITIMALTILSGFLASIVALSLLPYFENNFGILTNVKLLELSDFSNPLLKTLLFKTPGTFHHSIMVGALAENAAEAIGANPTFARIASYYHDIGKTKRPEYFIENQMGGENPHNRMKPSLSAFLIISHVKDGYIIGKKAKIPKEILDIMVEHHGTTVVQYFYNKALEEGNEVLISDFRYPGVIPQSKESGIILMADSIEAAVRAAEDKSRENIESIIRYIIRNKVEENQLADSNLTSKEMEKIIQAFLSVFKGAYHERIKYQKIDKENKE